MTTYKNGQIPTSKLVSFTQYSPVLGRTVTFYTSPYALQQWRALVAYVKSKYGVTLILTTSSTSVINGVCGNAYRDLAFQKVMRAKYGNGAATPGYSSHGGTYGGVDMLAFDVYNWASIGWAAFKAAAEKFGFITNFVSPTELWHIGLKNPFRSVSNTSGSSTSKIDEDPMPSAQEDVNTISTIVKPGAWTTREARHDGSDVQLYLANTKVGEIGTYDISFEATGPKDASGKVQAKGTIQVRTVVEMIGDDGKVAETRNQPIVEWPITSGTTFGQYIRQFDTPRSRTFLQFGVVDLADGESITINKHWAKKQYWTK